MIKHFEKGFRAIWLVVVENLIGVLQDRINHPDLPASIGNIGACSHKCRTAKMVSSRFLYGETELLPKDNGQISGNHPICSGMFLHSVQVLLELANSSLEY